MESRHFVRLIILSMCILFLTSTCRTSYWEDGKLSTGIQVSQKDCINHNGLFLMSNNSNFGFGFLAASDDSSFLLSIVHLGTKRVIWTANRGNPIANSDKFAFADNGNAYLLEAGGVVWTTDTANKGACAMELLNSGNLVLRGNGSSVIWQSFAHPTDTLISNQDFVVGMRLVSDPSTSNLSYILEIKSGDMILSAGYSTPQPYWSMGEDTRRTINANGGGVYSASFSANAWRFYDKKAKLLWLFNYSSDLSANDTWTAVLGNDGFITFNQLDNVAATFSTRRIPVNPCSTPEPCGAYFICSFTSNIRGQCPMALRSHNCGADVSSLCSEQKDSVTLVKAGDGLNYFALGFVSPSSKTDLKGCKASCLGHCTCLALVFDHSSGNCFLFDRIGSFQNSSQGSVFSSYVKVLSNGGSGRRDNGTRSRVIYISASASAVVFCCLLFGAFYWYRGKKGAVQTLEENSERHSLRENLQCRHFTYRELATATKNFHHELGEGGFGKVYRGTLLDGTEIAVKKLGGTGQGKKEFMAEVRTIGGISHHNLVNLIGYCAEGVHRLLVYEFVSNGSLDKWIFITASEYFLDWEKRFGIAVGIAKGLAYLHHDCHPQIVHRDIKPENVLLDDEFQAKVADFGLAKLITTEQSKVSSVIMGTEGYIAPERRLGTSTEKSDVYSYGVLLLDLVTGKRVYKEHNFQIGFLKLMKRGKLREILAPGLNLSENDKRLDTVMSVALLCIKDDAESRPLMTEVVEMLQGLRPIPKLPAIYDRSRSSLVPIKEEASSSSALSRCKTVGNFSQA